MLTCSSSSERQRPAAVRLRVLPATCSDVQYSQMEINAFFETRLTVMDFLTSCYAYPDRRSDRWSLTAASMRRRGRKSKHTFPAAASSVSHLIYIRSLSPYPHRTTSLDDRVRTLPYNVFQAHRPRSRRHRFHWSEHSPRAAGLQQLCK